ncbi:hypothetical protein TSAR_010183 [Trichomalopsis sarcophagae]|uniref:RPA-interacting protein C-terminal domain-containing protein n=1 Tax=Trichomalopsis sarcophagae TaxID=543379 RepID=A0A232ETU8_9HYME|nr:hypothetical protein TSAR_010183 [Trichomalopsis sarcophagae]
MSAYSPRNINHRVVKRGNDLSKFQEILRQKCHQQMRERRGQLFNKGRSGLFPVPNVQETLTEIVRQEFNKLATAEKSDITTSTKTIINSPLNQDEALREESELLAEEEQWILQEYERLMHSEEEMFDTLEDEVICPMCHKSFLEEIPDFIVCSSCGLKIRTEITLTKFKYNLESHVNMHSERCLKVPDFSLVYENNHVSLGITCLTCSCFYLVSTMEP